VNSQSVTMERSLTDNDNDDTHTHTFNSPLSGTTWVSRYQKGKTNLDHMQVSTSLQSENHASTPPLSFLQDGCPSCRQTNSEWQWHQLGHIQVYTSLQTDNHTSTPPLCFLQAGCPSCRPTNSVKALKANDDNEREFIQRVVINKSHTR